MSGPNAMGLYQGRGGPYTGRRGLYAGPKRHGGAFYPTDIASLVAGYDAERSELVTEVGSGIDTLESIKGSFDMRQTTVADRPAYTTSGDGKRRFGCSSDHLEYAAEIIDLTSSFDIWYISDSQNLPIGVSGSSAGNGNLELSLNDTGLTWGLLTNDAGVLVSGRQSTPGVGGLYVRRAFLDGTTFGAETVGMSAAQTQGIGAQTITTDRTWIGRRQNGTEFFGEIRGAYFFQGYLGTTGDPDYDNMKAFCESNHGATVS